LECPTDNRLLSKPRVCQAELIDTDRNSSDASNLNKDKDNVALTMLKMLLDNFE